MSKVICDLCGTSYSESATQCPICGCVRPADAAVVSEDSGNVGGYTYVKGGKFSKSNVKKRNQAKQSAPQKAPMNDEQKKHLGLIIVLICLLLIVIAMVIYLVVNLSGQNDSNDDTGTQSQTQNKDTVIACTGIKIKTTSVTLKSAGEKIKLEIECTPGNTTDIVEYESLDSSVVTVDSSGNVTCVGNGTADIKISCGEQVAFYTVACQIPEEQDEPDPTTPADNVVVELYRYDIDDANDPTWQQALFNPEKSNVSATDLDWTSEDPDIARVDTDGIVYAVSEGTTNIHATYNGQIVASCKITCSFEIEFDPSQEGGETESEFYFGCYNPGGYKGELVLEENHYSATLMVDESFKFGLIHKTDNSKNIYFQWARKNPNDSDQSVVCLEDGVTIKRVSAAPFSGSYCVFVATHEGVNYELYIYYRT